MAASGKNLLIGRVRLAGPSADPLVARLRLERRLATAPRPAELPPEAVLCVRALRDPLPGRLDLGGVGPPGPWERALAAELGRLTRAAARPALGPVPATAASVLFANRAELLACLAADWLDGLTASRWWWRRLLADAQGPRAPVRSWRDAPQVIPAALALLAAAGRARQFAAALEDVEAASLADTLARCYGLQLPSPAAEAPAAASAPAPSAAARPGAPELGAEVAPATAAVEWPWLAWAPECAGLPPNQERLLGLGLGLARAPARVRAVAVRSAARARREDVDSGPARPPAGGPQPAPTGAPPGAASAPCWPQMTGPTRLQAATRGGRRRGRAAPGGAPRAPGQPTALPAGEVSAGARGQAAAETSPADPSSGALPEAAWPATEPGMHTDLGGLFFLVNLGLFLDLYGDFTSPARRGLSLDLWDFVALVGRGLLAGADAGDPAWELLAALAGRAAGQAPGAGFEPPAAWRAPPAWLAPFGPHSRWTWSGGGGRLRVRHTAGFTVLDLPLAGSPRATLERELVIYRAAELGPALAPGRPQPRRDARPLERWLGLLLPYLRARLRLALACSGGELADLLLRRPARVAVSPARVDVFLGLADHPVAVRLAGLDRDPGWVPAAGRAVAFHFEVQDADAL